MRLTVAVAFLFSFASPFARAAAVLPEGPMPPAPAATQTEKPTAKPAARVPLSALPKKERKNMAFLAALPQPEAPRFSVPARLERLLPEPEAEPAAEDAYLDLFLNEEAEDLP